jgi:hypothetical protein
MVLERKYFHSGGLSCGMKWPQVGIFEISLHFSRSLAKIKGVPGGTPLIQN